MSVPYHSRIRTLRTEHGYLQREIADYLCTSVRSYSDYETGVTRLSVSQLIELARFYNVDMNYICGLSERCTSFPSV